MELIIHKIRQAEEGTPAPVIALVARLGLAISAERLFLKPLAASRSGAEMGTGS